MIFRKKLRYILVETTKEINTNEIRTADGIKREMELFLGQLPYFKANPQIASQFNNNVFVISVNRGYERNVILALAFIKNLDGGKIGFYTIKTSGTLRSLKTHFREIFDKT